MNFPYDLWHTRNSLSCYHCEIISRSKHFPSLGEKLFRHYIKWINLYCQKIQKYIYTVNSFHYQIHNLVIVIVARESICRCLSDWSLLRGGGVELIHANQFQNLFLTLVNQFHIYKAKQLPIYIKRLSRANQFPIPLKQKKIVNQILPVILAI